jgi:hypothetical protein
MDPGTDLQLHPGLYSQWKYLTENSRTKHRKKLTFCIGMPRSGTTLWCRLLEGACYSRCVGDKTQNFFEGVIRLYRDIKENQGQYFDNTEAERKGIFADETRGYYSRESELKNFRYLLANLLFANTFGHGFAKSTILGFGNLLLVPFVEMMRECFAEDDLTFVFMTREIPDAVDSLRSRVKEEMTPAHQADWDMTAHSYYDKQLEQMRAATDLDDTIWIKYEKFIEDPMPFLRRSRPLYAPNQSLVDKIMAQKLR